MEKVFFFLIVLILKTTPSVCQGCKTYECAIQAAEKLLNSSSSTDKYEKAIGNLDDAEDFAANDNIKKEKIKALRKRIFSAMEKDRQDAIRAKQDAINAKIETQKQRDAALNATQEAKRQRDTAQFQTEIAKKSALEEAKQTEIAKKATKVAKSKELAAKALLEYSKENDKDGTLALRLAYTALQIDTVDEAQNVFERIFLNSNEPFYLSQYKGGISCYNHDSSRLLTSLQAHDDITYLYDLKGKLYTTIIGEFKKLKSDSLRFLISYRDTLTYIYDWQGNLHNTIKGRFINTDKDASRFITRNKDSTYIYDWQGNKYESYVGEWKKFNQDSSKSLTSDGISSFLFDMRAKSFKILRGEVKDFIYRSSKIITANKGGNGFYRNNNTSTYIYDWQGQISDSIVGYFEGFNPDSSKILTINYDSVFLYDLNKKTYKVIDGYFWGFNADYSKLLLATNYVRRDTQFIYNWEGELLVKIKGSFSAFNSDHTRIHLFDNNKFFDWNGKPYPYTEKKEKIIRIYNRDFSKFYIYNQSKDTTDIYHKDGKLLGTIKGEIYKFNQDSSRFLTYDNDSTRIYDWNQKLYETVKGKVDFFNLDSSKYWASFSDQTFVKNFIKSNTEFWLGSIRYISPDSSKFVTNSNRSILDHEDEDEFKHTHLYDWQGYEYKSIKGELQTVNRDASKFLSYDGIYDWQGKLYGNTDGSFVTFNKDFSKFLIFNKDKSFSIYDWDGKLFGTIKGSSWGICFDSNRLIIEDSIYDWRAKRIGTIKGEFKFFNRDLTKFLTYDETSKSFRIYDCEGTLIQTIKEVDEKTATKNDKSRFILGGFGNNKSYIYDWQGKLYGEIEGSRLEVSNNDFSKFLFYDKDNEITRIYDWDGRLYSVIRGSKNINSAYSYPERKYQFNQDSSKFITYNEDSISIYDWQGRQQVLGKSELGCFNKDFSRFLIYNDNEKYIQIFDWQGLSYGKFNGILDRFNADSTRFLINNYQDDNSVIYDWQGHSFSKINSIFVKFNADHSMFLSYDRDSTRIYNWYGEPKITISGTYQKFDENDTKFFIIDRNKTRIQIYDWYGVLYGTIGGSLKDIYRRYLKTDKGIYDFQAKLITTITDETNIIIKNIKYGRILYFNHDSSKILTSDGIFDWLGQRYGETEGSLKLFNLDSSKFLLSNGKNLYISDWDGHQYAKIEGEIKYIKRDLSKFILLTSKTGYFSQQSEIDRMLVYDWEGKLYQDIEFREFRCFNRDSSKILTRYSIYDWEGTKYSDWNSTKIQMSGFIDLNQDSSKILTAKGIYNWDGKLLKKFKSDNQRIETFDSPLSQFCVLYDNYTVFYDMNWEISSVYSGQFFKIDEDGKHVVMRKPYYNGYIYETRPLYQNIHEFMKNEVAELTPDQRVLYGLEGYLKD